LKGSVPNMIKRAVGDKVIHRPSGFTGKIVDINQTLVYLVELDNGDLVVSLSTAIKSLEGE